MYLKFELREGAKNTEGWEHINSLRQSWYTDDLTLLCLVTADMGLKP